MDDKVIKKNIKLSFLMKPVSMLLALAYMPVALSFLGTERYGVWTIVLDVLAWIAYFDIGIGNGLRNKLAEAYSLREDEQCKNYVSTAYVVATAISLLFCVIFLLIWNCFDFTSKFNLNVGGYETDIAVAVSVVFVAVNFVLGLIGTILFAIQQNGYLSVINVIQQGLQLLVIWLLSVFSEANLIYIAVSYGIVNSMVYVAGTMIVFKKNKILLPDIRCVKKQYVRPLLSLGIGFFIMQISSMVLNTTDNLLISRLFDKSDVTNYSILYKCFYVFVQIHAIIIMPMWSAYTAASAKKNTEWIKQTMKKINNITIVLSVMVLFAVFLFKPFVHILFRNELTYKNELIVFVAVYMIAQMFANNYSSFLCGVGEIRVSVLLAFIGAIVNIPLSVLLSERFGWELCGIIGGSLFVMLLNCIVLPIVTGNWFRKRRSV
ncbi:MAG: oligosaccharide flippase family protein [Lachnospiraceae bacterium]|nr:oligosaccharide flippase family protein [Lachnospiraceae bacterium]